MTDYHTVYRGNEEDTTQWDDVQRKLGNLPTKVGLRGPAGGQHGRPAPSRFAPRRLPCRAAHRRSPVGSRRRTPPRRRSSGMLPGWTRRVRRSWRSWRRRWATTASWRNTGGSPGLAASRPCRRLPTPPQTRAAWHAVSTPRTAQCSHPLPPVPATARSQAQAAGGAAQGAAAAALWRAGGDPAQRLGGAGDAGAGGGLGGVPPLQGQVGGGGRRRRACMPLGPACATAWCSCCELPASRPALGAAAGGPGWNLPPMQPWRPPVQRARLLHPEPVPGGGGPRVPRHQVCQDCQHR
jgi:hypothetical protein